METTNDPDDDTSLLLMFAEDEEPTTIDESPQQESIQVRRQESQQSFEDVKSEVKDIDKEEICDLCRGTFTYKHFKEHKKTETHRLARTNVKKKRKPHMPAPKAATDVVPVMLRGEERKFGREKYTIRFIIELSEQNQHYQNTLTAFLALRLCLNNDNYDLKISMNNLEWKEFGDIVIEIFYTKSFKIYALQCKKIQGGNDILVTDLSAEKARFSLKQQCDILSELRDTKNYDHTYFKLFTVTNLVIDNDVLITYDDVIDHWQNDAKETWKGREVKVSLSNKRCLVNTTDDPDNICFFKITKCNDELVDRDLSKFSLYASQKTTESLKSLISAMIEDKFDIKIDISNSMVKYVGEYFRKNKIHKYNYKISKRDIVLKMAELILAPFILLPESTVEARSINIWDDTTKIFDVTVIKNNHGAVEKNYGSLNYILKTKISSTMDTSIKSLKIDKDKVLDEAIKSEMFDGFVGTSMEVSLVYLYVTLWKTELAPLVLKVNNETNLILIIKLINFLKTENVSVRFILMTDFNIHPSYFPENLKTFNTLEDLGKYDEVFLDQILQEIEIPVFEFNVSLKEIVEFNPDFLTKITPDVLLNMCLEEFSFKNVFVPMTDDIVENTLVFNDEMMKRFQKYLQKYDRLSYVVNVKGSPTRIEIPPDI